ncbi:MAG: YtxH domain-containing protein [Balneolaceae bacterium]|nr:YtxH domain-containing protein [Balneolaceae bacterium]
MNKSSNFLAGIVTGALAGAVVALLYAPDTGKNTRDRLSYQLSNYLEDLNELIEQLKKEKEFLVSEAKEKGDQVVLDAKEKAEGLISEAEELLHAIESAKAEA